MLSFEQRRRIIALRLVTICGAFCLNFFFSLYALAQEQKDTTKRSIQDSRITKEIVESITRRPRPDSLFNLKSEEAFLPHEGKIIRKIFIEQVGFERTFYNGSKKVKGAIIRISNALHSNTKARVIVDNLFIRENRPLNPYKVADNERHLRDLEFILDARIEVKPLEHNDSVDLVVITRDVFSLGGSFTPRGATDYRFKLYDANLAGWGQRLQFNGVVDDARTPTFGSEIIYSKNSVLGSLIDLSAGYTTLNTGSSYGLENESAYFIRLLRPLVSPYTRLAGGAEWSRNWSRNVELKPNSLFLKYRYHIYDAWIGYNIGLKTKAENRNRHFIALRWLHQDFREYPSQSDALTNPLYNDQTFVLAQITFFRQNFYKTRYIYGFGRTEDVPYGHSAYLTGGWSRQLNLNRPYFDAGIEKKVANNRGGFYEADIRGATFWQNGGLQDATALLSLSWFSHLIQMKNYKVRQYFQASFTRLINRNFSELLNINNEFGVKGFSTDSLRGEQRLGFTTETVVFTNHKFLGFRFAPLIFGDISFIAPRNKAIYYDKPFLGIGAGIRTRNENLIFGTIELRFTYYPRTIEELTQFKINLTSNLRVKYTASFIRPPGFLRYN